MKVYVGVASDAHNRCITYESGPRRSNDLDHRAAAKDVDFKYRAARGSVCNGMLAQIYVRDSG